MRLAFFMVMAAQDISMNSIDLLLQAWLTDYTFDDIIIIDPRPCHEALVYETSQRPKRTIHLNPHLFSSLACGLCETCFSMQKITVTKQIYMT